MTTDPFSELLDDVVRAVDEDLVADPGCPDFAAVLARAHELDPQRVPAEQVAEVAQWAPVVSIQQGHRRRRTRDDVELLAVIEGVRSHVEEDVAQRLGTPPLPRATQPSPPRARRVWALVLAAAAALLVVGAGVLQAGRGRLEPDEPARHEAALIGPAPSSEPSSTAMPAPRSPEIVPEPSPEVVPEPSLVSEPSLVPNATPTDAAATTPRARSPKRPQPSLEELDTAAHAAWRAGDLPEAERLFRLLAKRAGKDRLGDLAYGDLFTLARQTESPAKEATLWREYLRRFPRGRFADDARAGLCRRDSGPAQAQCWQRYLDDMPDGAHRAQAQRAVASTEGEP
jgi:hypothetical protein